MYFIFHDFLIFEGTENEKIVNKPEENHNSKDENDMNEYSEPSDCKIPKTDSGDSDEKTEKIDVKIVYNKNKYDVSACSNTTIADFKKQLQTMLGK